MKIEYKQGKMIITHESGHVDEYQRLDLERFKSVLVQDKQETQICIDQIDESILKINESIGAI